MDDILIRVLQLALFIPAIVLHEVSHGYVSYRLGDPTAKRMGRLSLNPIKHVDPFGTILLPLLLWFGGGPIFGYAKPVPINPGYYRDYRKGMMLTGLAGPATNLTLALLSGLAARLVVAGGNVLFATASDGFVTALGWIFYAFYYFAQINLVLMFFNLIPIPPLDGSRVLPLFLSDRALESYHRVERYGILVFFGAMLLLPSLLNVDLIGGYFSITVLPLLRLLTGVGL
ncbi:MAG: site-2 protease family protein [Coriobacteriia bacterium]|nr:site-2 protease family protein [Coriobacteriia bacterium]